MTNNQVKVGQTVKAIIQVWREDELPTERNFLTAKVTQVIKKARNCFYVRLAGYERLVPMDRVRVA